MILRAENLRRCCAALERTGAAQAYVTFYTWQTGLAFAEAGRMDDARAELRHGIESNPADDVYVFAMQVDLADLVQRDGCWREARELLAKAAPALALEDRDVAQRFARTEVRGTWYGVHGEIDLKLGLLERASSRFDEEAACAVEAWKIQQQHFPTQHAMLKWAALDHKLKLMMAGDDYVGVDAQLERLSTDPLYADVDPELLVEFAVHSGAARYERERRGEPNVPDAKATLESVLADSTAREVARDDASLLLAKLAIERGDFAAARPLIDAARTTHSSASAPSCGGDPVAVTLDTFAARVRFETATDDAGRRQALVDLEAAFAEFLRAWAAAPDREGGIAFLRFGERYLVLDELVRMCLAVDGPELGARRALQAIGDAQLLGSLAQSWELARKSLDAWLAPLVKDGAGVLLYQSGRGRSSLFVIDAAGIAVHDLDADWKIRRRVGELRNAVARAVRGTGVAAAPPDAEARALGLSLLPPEVRARLATWSAAWVIGDENFGHLALDLVPLEDGRLLGEVLPLDYVPSLPVAAELATRAAARGVEAPEQVQAGVVGAPTISGASAAKWNPAPLAIEAARWELWSDAWNGRWNAALGPDATPAALCGAAARGVDVLQVVTHGIEDLERDASMGLLLAGDGGELWSDALTGSAPRLVLLAACQIDARPLRRGDDGRAGWAGRFASAGSDCVVLTPVDLELGRALEFFERVHRSLSAGDAPSRALVRARRELASGGRRAQDYLVYAWGAGSQPVVARAPGAAVERGASASSSAWKIGAASVIVLAALILVVARKR